MRTATRARLSGEFLGYIREKPRHRADDIPHSLAVLSEVRCLPGCNPARSVKPGMAEAVRWYSKISNEGTE